MDDAPTSPRYMMKARGDTYPTCLVGVAVGGITTVKGDHPAIRRESLTAWNAAGWTARAGVIERRWQGSGTEPSSFWRAVEHQARRHGQVWIVSHQCARVCALLGLWQLVEEGSVYGSEQGKRPGGSGHPPTGVSSVQTGGNLLGSRSARVGSDVLRAVPVGGRRSPNERRSGEVRGIGAPGCFILEDPPTILQLRLTAAPGRVCWVDVRNYGIDSFPTAAPSQDGAAWLADVMERMVGVLRTNRFGSLKVTAGSQAMFTYRRAFLRAPVLIHREPEALALERAAYYGGRCEARRLGHIEGPVYHVDFRSLYPSVCATVPLPTLLSGTGEGALPSDARDGGSTLPYIAECTVTTQEQAYPVKAAAGVIYPVGTFRTTLCGPELKDALDLGRVVRIHRWARYRLTWALQGYALDLYGLLARVREQGDEPLTSWLKSLLVCLPGKFGQHGGKWVPGPRDLVPAPWCEWYTPTADRVVERYRSIGWECWRETGDELGRDSCPAISAWVCSAGRMRLLDTIRSCGWRNAIYHDTDSCILTATGYDHLHSAGRIVPNSLGALRLVGEHRGCDIYGVKHYALDGVVKCSGVPKGDVAPGPTPDAYWYRCWLRRDVARGRAPEAEEVLREYRRTGAYRHGTVDEDGTVRPFRLEEP